MLKKSALTLTAIQICEYQENYKLWNSYHSKEVMFKNYPKFYIKCFNDYNFTNWLQQALNRILTIYFLVKILYSIDCGRWIIMKLSCIINVCSLIRSAISMAVLVFFPYISTEVGIVELYVFIIEHIGLILY